MLITIIFLATAVSISIYMGYIAITNNIKNKQQINILSTELNKYKKIVDKLKKDFKLNIE